MPFLTEQEQSFMIWSKGHPKGAYAIDRPTEHSVIQDDMINYMHTLNKDGDGLNVAFIRLGTMRLMRDVNLFAANLHILKKPIVLVTTDGGRSVPSEFAKHVVNAILENQYITRWYTQNYDGTIRHEKLQPYPIGFDLHTKNWLVDGSAMKKLVYMIDVRTGNRDFPIQDKIPNKIFCDAHNSKTHGERELLRKAVEKNSNVILLSERLSFQDITKEYNKYQFVLAPRGNGLDTHRTWELFLAGAIVITKTSSLDEMYIKHDLPVVILQDWNELNDDIENKMARWHTEHVWKTDFKHIFMRLRMNYWLHSKTITVE